MNLLFSDFKIAQTIGMVTFSRKESFLDFYLVDSHF